MSPNRLSPTFLQARRKSMKTNSQTTIQSAPASTPQSMNTNAQSESQPVVASAQEPAVIPEANSVSEATSSTESSMTPPSESSTEQRETSDTSPPEGPLSTLAQKAADTQLGRTASQNIPESARPTLHRASRVLNTVDGHLLAAKETLDTHEGRRVVKCACEFMSSLLAFVGMLFTAGVASAERKLGMEPGGESSPKRFVKVCSEAASRVRAGAETREKQVDGSYEAWIYAHARQAMDGISSAFKILLKGVSKFSGPGKEYVAPAADSVISMLPEDIQTAVRESPGPVESLRSGLGLERCNNPRDDRPETTEGAAVPNDRMKVD